MGLSFSQGHLSKAVIIRIEPGSDIIEGVEDVCRQLDIKSGINHLRNHDQPNRRNGNDSYLRFKG
jgi:predicted DNA-binding protein with PD1-like motif